MSIPLHLLLVEDSEDDALLVTRALQRGGYELNCERVDTPEDMRSALADSEWDVIIADYSMPRFSGLEALKLLKHKGLDIPFIIVSGTIGEDVAVDVMRSGAQDYVMKGNLTRLVPAVQRELAEAQVRRDTREIEDLLGRRHREIRSLYKIGRDISAILDLSAVLESIASHARDLLEADNTIVYLLEPDDQTLRAIVAQSEHAELIKATHIPLGQGFVGCVAQSGKAEIIDDLRRDARSISIPGMSEDQALMCAPLVYKEKVIGVMALLRLAEHELFDEGDLYFLDALARQAAVAITNARMFAQEEERATQLARALEKQQELDRFKSEFIRNVSHELRTPLGLILGNAEMLNTGYLGKLQPEQQKLMAVVARRARLLTNMVEDFTIILSEQPPEVRFAHLDLAELVRNIVVDLQNATEKGGLDLDLQIAPDLPLVWSDKTCLSRAFYHLLDNARKFTPRGGNIVVNLEQEGEALVLSVSDTGIGISKDMFELIFELGFQVDASTSRIYEGTGLGLALVKKVVGDHRGTVGVASQLGQGSTFTIVLPVNDAPTFVDAFVF